MTLQRHTRLDRLLSKDEFEAALRGVLEERYHIHHPFHKLMNAGNLSYGQMQAWALNRYCYQAIIPKKDAIILSRADDPVFRREWRKRLIDHDGEEENDNQGGLARWLRLAEGVGLDADLVILRRAALPATRFAVENYISLVSDNSFLVAVASSLTELFSPIAIGERVPAMLARYDYINEDILSYFTPRLTQAPRDAEFTLELVKDSATTADEQSEAIDALIAKCDILWAMLDALYHAYVAPGHVPPGAFAPQEG